MKPLALALGLLFSLVAGEAFAQGYCPAYSQVAKVTTTSYKISGPDNCSMIVATTVGSTITVPPPGTNGDVVNGFRVKVFNNSAGTITLAGTINGVVNPTVARGYTTDLVIGGSSWYGTFTSTNPVGGGTGAPPGGSIGALQTNLDNFNFGGLTPGAGVATWLATPSGANLASALTSALPTTKGGTGQTSYTNGQLLIGNTTTGSLSPATLLQGANVTITNGPGTITIAATGGSGTPAGVNGDFQVNSSSSFGAVTPGAGVATWFTTPSGANLATALTSALPATKGGTGLTALGTGVATFLGSPGGNGLITWLAPIAANSLLMNATGGSASATAVAVPACADTGGNHLNYASGTISCGTSGSGGGASPTLADTHGHTFTTPTQISFAPGTTLSGANSSTVTATPTNEISTQAGATYTYAASDANTTVHMTNVSPTTITLLTGATMGNGATVSFLCDAGCTINRAGSDTINGATSLAVAARQTGYIASDGTSALGGGILPGLDPTNASNLSSGKVPNAQGGAGTLTGVLKGTSGTVSAAVAGTDYVAPIANGTATLGTSSISSAACATAVTVSATGVATTDVVSTSFNGDPTAVTGYIPATAGMLAIIAYPTLNNVNFKVCNNTASSITPGAITLNWRVAR